MTTNDAPPAARLVLGAMRFGTTVDTPTSFALLDRFTDAGGEWIDTADCYAFWDSDTGHGGQSEDVLGHWLAARPGMRDRIKISTKFGAEPRVPGQWPATRTGLSRTAIRTQLTSSLRRLGVDHVDLAWAHMEDRTVPVTHTAEACAELVTDGTTRRIGLSNHPAWRIERARAHALAHDLEPVTALQHWYTYVQPRGGTPLPQAHPYTWLNDEHLDLARTDDLDTWAYTPLQSGAYDNPAKRFPHAFDHPGTTARLAALDHVARELGATRSQTVLAWLTAHGIRPILGGSTVGQLDEALAAMELVLPDDAVRVLDAASDDEVPEVPGD
ncbi:aldo/keto reductase [Myceligenerans crystallogenes]|uniref:Aldo/keto reductase n=1 Tax=Myceligenerans crystallogenes TaxID=316335 RepID=A0ABP4ZJI6_9MICO